MTAEIQLLVPSVLIRNTFPVETEKIIEIIEKNLSLTDVKNII